MPILADPHIAAQFVSLRGPAFAPDETARPAEVAGERHWQALVDARLIGTVQPLGADALAGIAAAEVALGVRRRPRERRADSVTLV